MSGGYVDEHCPQRGPGLTHTQKGLPGSPCVECGRPVYPRGFVQTANVTAASPMEFGDFAGFIAKVFRVVPVNPDAEPKQIPAPPVVEPDVEGIASQCSCFVCRFPDAYPEPQHVAKRVMHAIQHRDFDEYLMERDFARFADIGVPSGRCKTCGPGVEPHGWHS